MLGVSLTPSFLGGTDFAVGGAMTSPGTFSLVNQMSSFMSALGAGSAPSGALYVIAGGGNNVRGALESIGGGAPFFPTVGSASFTYANDIGQMVDQLQAKGVPNSNIIVWNAPNVGLAPAVQATGFGTVGTQIADALNGALLTRLATEPGVKVFDVFGLGGSPGAAAFTNKTDACGAAGVGGCLTSLFWDGIHPTTAAHGLIASQMFALAVPEPSEYLMLLTGVLLIAGVVRRRVRT
jgi:phospholipase/lecithinase/hemolysin